jgi:GNAT superfamily N-acetyltransferase
VPLVAFMVRQAALGDAPAISLVAAAAWRDTYAGMLRPNTIETFIERAYAIDRLERRIDRDVVLLAVRDDEVVAFCDAAEAESEVGVHIDLYAIYALPEVRGQGAGTALLTELQARFPSKPIAAEVLVGNRKGEVFYERRGFVPRERIDTELFGEPVVERRWWLAPGRARPERRAGLGPRRRRGHSQRK